MEQGGNLDIELLGRGSWGELASMLRTSFHFVAKPARVVSAVLMESLSLASNLRLWDVVEHQVVGWYEAGASILDTRYGGEADNLAHLFSQRRHTAKGRRTLHEIFADWTRQLRADLV